MPHANDDFANATLVSGTSGSIAPFAYDGISDPATSESGEVVFGIGQTLWWKWIADNDGTAYFSTEGSPNDAGDPTGLDTRLTVFTNDFTNWHDTNDDGGSSFTYNSRVGFTAVGGTTYYIQLDFFDASQQGTVHLNWGLSDPLPPAPTITDFSYDVGYFGTGAFGGLSVVTVTGTLFDTLTFVWVGDQQLFSYIVDSPTQLHFTIPYGFLSGTIRVDNEGGSGYAGSTLFVYYWGPWLDAEPQFTTLSTQYPIGSEALTRSVTGYVDQSVTQPSFDGTWVNDTIWGDVHLGRAGIEEGKWHANYFWEAGAAMVVLSEPTNSMLPVVPSPFPSGALGIEWEGGDEARGTPLEDPAVMFMAQDRTITYLHSWIADDTNYPFNTTTDPDAMPIWHPDMEFRRMPNPVVPATTFPDQSDLLAMPVDMTQPFWDPDRTATYRPAGGGFYFGELSISLSPSVPDRWSNPITVPWSEWLTTPDSWWIGRGLDVPTAAYSKLQAPWAVVMDFLTTGGDLDVNNPLNGTPFLVQDGRTDVAIKATWIYQPPRYRLLSNTPITRPWLNFQVRADTASTSSTTVNVKWFVNAAMTDLGNFTSDVGTGGDAPWHTFVVPLAGIWDRSKNQRVEITKVSGDNAHVRSVWVLDIDEAFYFGEYPKTFTYNPDVEDGVLASLAILNDGGTLPDSAYYAEQGADVDPSPYNYPHLNPASPGASVNGTDGWVCDPAWYYDGNGWPVLEKHTTGSDGSFNALGYSLCTRSDGLHSAPFHHIVCGLTYYGSRGSNGHAAVWGYKGPNDYWFAMPSSNNGPGRIACVSGGVETTIAPFTVDSWVDITVNHDFGTGLLTIDTYEPFLGDVTHFSGTYPWSVANGRVGWLGRDQNGGSFWDSATVSSFQLIYSLGSIGYNRQFSMRTLSVVPQTPATWYFTSIATTVPSLRLASRDDQYSVPGSVPRIGANNHPTSGQTNKAGRIMGTNTYW